MKAWFFSNLDINAVVIPAYQHPVLQRWCSRLGLLVGWEGEQNTQTLVWNRVWNSVTACKCTGKYCTWRTFYFSWLVYVKLSYFLPRWIVGAKLGVQAVSATVWLPLEHCKWCDSCSLQFLHKAYYYIKREVSRCVSQLHEDILQFCGEVLSCRLHWRQEGNTS